MSHADASNEALLILDRGDGHEIGTIEHDFTERATEFHGFCPQVLKIKIGFFSPFRGVFFRITVSMRIFEILQDFLDFILMRLPVDFIDDIFKSPSLRFGSLITVPKHIKFDFPHDVRSIMRIIIMHMTH
jgi:hypothetical protein